MGDIQRIFYYHVINASLALVPPYINLLASIAFLWRQRFPRQVHVPRRPLEPRRLGHVGHPRPPPPLRSRAPPPETRRSKRTSLPSRGARPWILKASPDTTPSATYTSPTPS